VPWTPEPTATVNTGAWVDDTANYDWGQWNNDASTEPEVTEDPAATLEAFNDIWDDSTAAGTFTVNTPETTTGGEWDPATLEIPTAGEDSAPINSFIDTNWQNDMPWINVDADTDADDDANTATIGDSFIDTNWQLDMPWLNDEPSTTTPAEEGVTAGDAEPTTADFEEMFDQIDTAGDNDWESVTEDESDF
jgi:hypothetical protein